MTRLLKGLVPFIAVALFSSQPLAAQGAPDTADDGPPMDRPAIGLSAGFLSNMHSATFTKLPGIASCCTGYDGGTGGAPTFGAVARFVIDDTWSLHLLLRYADYSATLTAEEEIGPVLTPRGPEPAAVERRPSTSGRPSASVPSEAD